MGAGTLDLAIGVPEAAVGLLDIPTGGRVGKFLENEGGSFGFRPKQAREITSKLYSDATQAAEQKFQDADGIVDKTAVALQNPSVIAKGIGTSLGLMGAGGVVGRGLMAGTRLGQMGAKGAAMAGAAGEGVVGAGSAAEQIRQETDDGLLTGKQAGLAAATGLATGAIGFAGNKVANRLGIGDADMMMAQGKKGMAKDAAERATAAAVNPLAQPAQKSILRQMGEGAIAEGVLEELPQSVSEQILQNEALGKSWSEGLDDAVVMGILSGGAMGAGAAGYRGFTDKKIRDAAKAQQEAAAASGAPGTDAKPADAKPADANWTTSAGAAGEVQPGTAPASDANAPNLDYETLPGAAAESVGNEIPFDREFDTGGLSLQSTKPVAVPPVLDHEALREKSGLVMPAQLDTGRIEVDTGLAPLSNAAPARQWDTGNLSLVGDAQPQQQVPLSQRMGLNPNAGALSKAAVMAVDSGASPVVQSQSAPAAAQPPVQQQAAPEVPAGVDPDTGEISLQAQMNEVKDRIAYMQQQGAAQGWNKEMVAQRNALQTQLTKLEVQAAKGSKQGASTTGAPAPAALTGITQILAKQIPDMSAGELQQAIAHYGPNHNRTKKLQKALQALAQKPLTAIESGAKSNGTQANQAQQSGAQPAQTGAAQASAPATQSAAQGVATNATPAQHDGAQAPVAPSAKSQAASPQAAPAKQVSAAESIAKEGNAQREQERQRQLDASERWTRMTTIERQAVAGNAPGLNAIARKNLHTRAWADIGEKTRAKLVESLVNPTAGNAAQAPGAIKSEANNAPETPASQTPVKQEAQPISSAEGKSETFSSAKERIAKLRQELENTPQYLPLEGAVVEKLEDSTLGIDGHGWYVVKGGEKISGQYRQRVEAIRAMEGMRGPVNPERERLTKELDDAIELAKKLREANSQSDSGSASTPDKSVYGGSTKKQDESAVAAAEQGKKVKPIVLDAPQVHLTSVEDLTAALGSIARKIPLEVKGKEIRQRGRVIVTMPNAPASIEPVIAELGKALREAMAREGVTLPSNPADMTRDQFAIAYEFSGIIPQFELTSADLKGGLLGSGGMLAVDVDKLFDKIQAGAAPTAQAAIENAEATTGQAEAAGKDSEKQRWIKATLDKSRLNGPNGVQIDVAPNGGIVFKGNPNSSKDARALKANYDEALKAGATPSEIAAALVAEREEKRAAFQESLKKPVSNDASNADKTASDPLIVDGLRVSLSTVKVGDTVKPMWKAQSVENAEREKRGERQLGGDSLHDTKEQAIAAAKAQAQDAKDKAQTEQEEAQAKKLEAEAAAAKKADTINGFTEGMAPNTAALAAKALDKLVRWRDKVASVREHIEAWHKAGELKVSTTQEPRIKPMSRTTFNRASQRQQDAHEKRMKEAGNKTVYWVNNIDLGKTAFDYASHLLGKDESQAEQAASRSEGSTATPAGRFEQLREQGSGQDKGVNAFAKVAGATGEAVTTVWSRWNSVMGFLDTVKTGTGAEVAAKMQAQLLKEPWANEAAYPGDGRGMAPTASLQAWRNRSDKVDKQAESFARELDREELRARDAENFGVSEAAVSQARAAVAEMRKRAAKIVQETKEGLEQAEVEVKLQEAAEAKAYHDSFEAPSQSVMAKKPTPASITGWSNPVEWREKTVYTNGHLIDATGTPPHLKGWQSRMGTRQNLTADHIERVMGLAGVRYGSPHNGHVKAEPLALIDDKKQGRLFFEVDGKLLAVDLTYAQYFVSKVKGATFMADPHNLDGALSVMDGEKLAGIVMPVRMGAGAPSVADIRGWMKDSGKDKPQSVVARKQAQKAKESEVQAPVADGSQTDSTSNTDPGNLSMEQRDLGRQPMTDVAAIQLETGTEASTIGVTDGVAKFRQGKHNGGHGFGEEYGSFDYLPKNRFTGSQFRISFNSLGQYQVIEFLRDETEKTSTGEFDKANWRADAIRIINSAIGNKAKQSAAEPEPKPEQTAAERKQETALAYDNALMAGTVSIEDYMKATGLTDEDIGTFDTNGLRAKAEQQARINNPYLGLVNRMHIALSEMMRQALDAQAHTPEKRKSKEQRIARINRDRDTLDMLARKFEHPFDNRYVSKLSPILKTRFGKQLDGVETGERAQAAFRDESYRLWAEKVVEAARVKRAKGKPEAESQAIEIQQPEAATVEQFPMAEAVQSYNGISHSGRSRADQDKQAFDNFMESAQAAAEKLATTDAQREALAAAADSLRADYLQQYRALMNVRAGTYSGFVAGRGNLNSKQANSRNSALDKAMERFDSWVANNAGRVRNAVLAARTPEQVKADQAALAAQAQEKADKKAAALKATLLKFLSFKSGDNMPYGKSAIITRVSYDKDGYPSSLKFKMADGSPVTDDKLELVPTLKDEDETLEQAKARIRALVDEVRAENPELNKGVGAMRAAASAKAQKESPAQAPAPAVAPASYLDRHNAIEDSINAGTLELDDYKSAFAELESNQDAVLAELSKLTKAQLLKAGGAMFTYRMKDDKKDAIVLAAYQKMLDTYALGRSYGPSSYFLSAASIAKNKADKAQALRELVGNTTAEDLAARAAEIKAARDEVKAQRDAAAEALANPKSLQDFRGFMRHWMDRGETMNQAYLRLSPEQRQQYDALEAAQSKEAREAAKRRAQVSVVSAGNTTAGEVIATKHTKHGHDLYVVQLAERVERDAYDTLNSSAKRMGGSYSSYRGNGAVPGFQFRTREAAEAFQKLVGGDTAQAQELANQRRDAFDDDKSQTAAERLRTMADALDERATEALGADRKVNTARRARFAASADAAARSQQALAGTMRNIAQAIDAGTTQFLDGVRQRVQVEYLMGQLRTAKSNQLQAKYPDYGERMKRQGEPIDAETVDFAAFPTYEMYRSDWASLARQLLALDGGKKLGATLARHADDVTEAYTDWAKENLLRVSHFGSKHQGGFAEFASKDDAERAIKRSGLVGKAVVLPIKRGQNRVILSPSEAMQQGLWQGDGDKRMSIGAEFIEDLVKLGKRKGSKALALPWQLESAYENRQRLQRMGILTRAEFRSALRELASLQQEMATPDRIKELERSMVGRANDGLDFFPTSPAVVQSMLDAAEISEGMAVLEPSAGMGHIADAIVAESGVWPDVVELSASRRELLEAKGYQLADASDFMQMQPRSFYTFGDTFRAPDGTEGIMRGVGGIGSQRVRLEDSEGGHLGYFDRSELVGVAQNGVLSGYDRIIMNPPFSDGRDIQHVQHAYNLLRPGGRIVAIMGEGAFFQSNKRAEAFRDWLDERGATNEKLPEGSFMDPSLPVNTGVAARMVVIDKPAGDMQLAPRAVEADSANYEGAAQRRPASAQDKAVMQAIAEGKSARDVLRVVASGSKDPFLRQVARLLLKSGITPNIEFGHIGKSKGNPIHGQYRGKTDTIAIAGSAEYAAERIFMHEAMHAATMRALAKPGLPKLQLQKLLEHVRKQKGVAGFYGTKNVDEFVAEVFTNPDFQAALRKIKAPTGSTIKSAWDGFVRILRSILGLKNDPNNALSQALQLGVAAMREDIALRKQGVRGEGAANFGTDNFSALKASALDQLNKTFTHEGKVSLWDKSVGTMRHLAERAPAFKPVYEAASQNIDDVSMLANDAANMAPRILPRVETLADLRKKPVSVADNKAVAKPLFEGTLIWARDENGKPTLVDDLQKRYANLSAHNKAAMLLKHGKIDAGVLAMWQGLPAEQFEKLIYSRFESKLLKPGIVWSDAELKSQFGTTDNQISLYRETRAAIDRSIDMTARTDMLRVVGDKYEAMREAVLDQPSVEAAAQLLLDTLEQDAKADPDSADRLGLYMQQIKSRMETAADLQKAGYAPLTRFGRYTVDVVDANGERQYFGMYESQRESNLAKMQLASEFKGATITQGTMSAEAYKLFAGVTPETLEQFGEMLGLKAEGNEAQDKAFQEFLKLTKNNHNAMKRLIHRKGVAGFSEDVGRVVASFVYSNARAGAMGLNAGKMDKAIGAIPKEQGELKDLAMGLRSYIRDPQEEGQAVRGMLFAQYLGGSIASAFVNTTQPFAVTLPWLSQYGGMKKASAQLARALKDMATKGHQYEADLAKALQSAEDDGTVSPQEIHQLMAQARGSGMLRSGDGTKAGDMRAKAGNLWEQGKVLWGQPFALAEQFNRRSTFIAAYRTAKDQGIANPAEFARQAVLETQFVYSKANKPRWARGAVGGTLFTFKTYSVSYLELMQRMWTQGGPEGKRAVGWALAMLVLMSGAGGVPFMEDAEDLIDGAGQLMGYNISAKQWRKELLASVVGAELGEFMEQGLSGLPGAPIDVSGRLGMGNLIPGTGLFLNKPNRERDLMEMVGPAGDLVARGFTGARKLLGGDVAGAALEVSPTAVRNLAKGVDMGVSGMYKDTKGYKVIDTTLAEAVAKAFGFQPKTVAEVQEANSFMQRSKSFYIQTSSEIKAQWADALFRKDEAAVQRVRERLARWNRDNPEQPIVVKMPDVWKRVREMGKDKQQRIADTAPKALREQMREMARTAG